MPQKALAAEKYEELHRRYEPAGIKVVVSSRDRRAHDAEIERFDFHIAVVVFEKLQALLIGKPQLMEAVGLVVVDELQMITDKDRGPTLELLLTKLRVSTAKPRIIGLSAVLGRAQALADWLGARLLVDTRRPVDLRKGVLCRGQFRYREHNSGATGVEPFADFRSEKREELLLAAVEELVRRGEQVLAFVPDRATTVLFARRLAQRLSPGSAPAAVEELRQLEETHAREVLLAVVATAIAFHNSDLSPEEREIVERHFRTGAIRALFSTSTLAVGMNLPVKNVVLDHQRWEYLRRYGRWSLQEISRSEYENMSGRAGRLSLVDDFGRSILVTYSPFEADVWLQHFAGGEFEEIRPTLADAPLENHVLDLMASGLASSRAELEETGREAWAWLTRLEAELARLEWAAGSEDAPPAADLVEVWRTSVSAFDRYGHVFEAARSRARLAAALHATGDEAGSREVVATAREVGVTLGAAPLLAELDAVHPSGDASASPESPLTPREVEVLALVAQGLTNGQIGRQLFISTKTVSVHVSNLLAKLGAAGRTEAAAIARRRGLVP